MKFSPNIVGIGGAASGASSTEHALSVALNSAKAEGAKVTVFPGDFLAALPHYAPGGVPASANAQEFISAIRVADGIIIASPAYHGSISGLVKNAIDYLEETSRDDRVYLDGVPVGLIVTAYGWQATGSALSALRGIVHALRGWPTPLGAAVKSVAGLFLNGHCTDEAARNQLEFVGKQVVEFALLRKAASEVITRAIVH